MPAVVTLFVRHGGEVLCIRRSADAGTYPDCHAVISGFVEPETDDPVEDAWRELREETGIDDATLVRRGDPFSVIDGDYDWTVHPFLFEAPDREVHPNHEFDEWEWVSPTALIGRETVPALWETYRRIAPDVGLIKNDETHGSAWLSVRALEVVRDVAGEIAFGASEGDWDDVAAVARDLRGARPSMVVVQNRIDRVMAEADRTPEAVHDRAIEAIEAVFAADEAAAARAAEMIAEVDDDPGSSVATLSRSGTVAAALEAVDREVLIGESRPACEGVAAAEELAAAGVDVTVTTDAALPGLIRDRDVGFLLLGADRILPSGAVVNKVGSYPTALAAADAGIPVYVVAAADKVASGGGVIREPGNPADVYDSDAAVRVENPIFERVPSALITAVVTEDGALDDDAIADRAREHDAMGAWATGGAAGEVESD